MDALRRELRVADGREPSSGAGSIDSRTVKASRQYGVVINSPTAASCSTISSHRFGSLSG